MSNPRTKWWVIGGILLTVAAVNDFRRGPPPPSSVQKAAAAPAPDPEYDAALLSVMAVRKTQRNPDSFALERALVTTKAVCLSWRGQNGFGGMSWGKSVIARDRTYALNDHEDGFTRAWNRECANKPGRDLTTEMQGQLRYNSSLYR